MNFKCRSFRKGFSSAFFFLTFLIFCHLKGNSQVLDSLQASLKKTPRLLGGVATKNTFINGFRSPIYTARIGLDFDSRIKFGMGISWLKLSKYEVGRNNTPFYIDKTFADLSGYHTVHPALQFRYVNLFVDYVYYNVGKWQFSVPVQIGIGDSRYKYSYGDENVIEARHIIFLYEPVVSGQYKIIKWFGVGLDVGYRIMVISNKNIGSKFNSPVYDIKTIIFWGELYKAVMNEKNGIK